MGIRLLIADDHAWIREGIRAVCGNTEIEVAGEATSGDEAIGMVLQDHTDVMLLDLKMPGKDGFEVLAEVKQEKPDLPVVIYSQHDRVDFKRRARELGASGYLNKRVEAKVLIHAIRQVAKGERLWDEETAMPGNSSDCKADRVSHTAKE